MSKLQPLTEAWHWATCLRQFEAAACANNWTEKDKAVSLVLALKGPAAELLHKVPPESQNIYAELIKALELRYGDKHLRDAVSYTHLDVYKRQKFECPHTNYYCFEGATFANTIVILL